MLGPHHEALDPCQGSAINPNSLTGAEIRPRHEQTSRGDQRLEIFDLAVADRGRDLANADNLLNARCLQNPNPIFEAESPKEIPREERLLDYFDAVGPLPFEAPEWQVCIQPAERQLRRGVEFPSRGYPDCEPSWHIWTVWHANSTTTELSQEKTPHIRLTTGACQDTHSFIQRRPVEGARPRGSFNDRSRRSPAIVSVFSFARSRMSRSLFLAGGSAPHLGCGPGCLSSGSVAVAPRTYSNCRRLIEDMGLMHSPGPKLLPAGI